MSIPPIERARSIMRWLAAETDVCSWDGTVVNAVENRIAEEIGDALKELSDGFLRKPDGRGSA